MDKQFIAIVQKLIAEQGKDALLARGKSFLADYTGTDYKKERRLFVQALEAGAAKAIDRAGDLEICKKQQVRLLHEDYFLDPHIAADVVDTLALILRGDTAKTAPVTPPPAPAVPAASLQKRGCRNCGKELEPAWKTCPYCEVPVAPAPKVQPASPQNMVRIQGGTFLMGSPAFEANRRENEVQHSVTVSSFYMGKYEVTVGEFRRFVNAAGYKTEAERNRGGWVRTGSEWERKADANWKNPYMIQGDNHPVVLVSWNDVVRYCNWRSEQEGLRPAYSINGEQVSWNQSTNGYRLPTEAEWEYACRAGTTTPFNTGNNITTDQANYNGNHPYNKNPTGIYRGKTTEVGSFAPNPWGLYDMHGNVWEWCWDWYGSYTADSQTDPTGASSGSDRVSRGGCWFHDGWILRSAERGYGGPSNRGNRLGFRVLRPSV